MRICILANSGWNIYNYRRALVHDLSKEGHEVIICAPQDEYSSRLDPNSFKKYMAINHMAARSVNPITDLFLYLELKQKLSHIRPDVLLTFTIKCNIYGGLAADVRATKVISTVTGLGTAFLKAGIVSFMSKMLYKWALKKVDKVVFQNDADKSLFKKWQLAPDDKLVKISGSGIDANYFNRSSEYGEGIVYDFLFVGRMLQEKGIFEFLEAIGQLKDSEKLRIGILGQLASEEKIMAKIQNLITGSNSRIELIGNVDDVRSYLEDSRCVVLPSYREGMPKSLMEAMAMEVPVIATDVAGSQELVQHGVNGFLCQPQNASDLAKMLTAFLSLTHEEQREMSIEGRRLILSKYTNEKINAQYLSLISE